MKIYNNQFGISSFGKWIGIIAMLFLYIACDDADVNAPFSKGGPAPAMVTNIKVTNTPGGAEILYTPPADINLSYVYAVVQTPEGKKHEYKASPYSAKIEVVGLGSTREQTVQLYSVSRSEVKSEPVLVSIHPLNPPFVGVFKTIKLTEDFGGLNIQYENISEAELSFTLGIVDKDNVFTEYNTYYSRASKGNYSWRGLPSTETKFALYIRDRWDNFSDTLYVNLTPLYEEKLDKTKFRDLTLPGDAKIYTTEWNISKTYLWDETFSTDFNNPYGNWLNCSTELPNTVEPKWITFDLGQTAQLSRMRLNHYYTYWHKAPRRYEIWGSTTTPPVDGSWTGWIKLASHEQIKPSGLPTGSYGPGDAEAWEAGDNINFSRDLPPIKYIRFKCIENWEGTSHMSLAEVTFFGSVTK